MSSHCLGRLSNFNCYVAYINPSMGMNASCHLPVISPGMSLASFIQSHALAPASQAVGQRYRRWASKNPLYRPSTYLLIYESFKIIQ